MDSRESLRAVLNNKIPDRVPWSGLITDYSRNLHKKELAGISTKDFLDEAYADIFNWLGMEAKSLGVEIRTYRGDMLQKKDKSKYFADMENISNGNFILSSGDSVPADAKIENIKSIPGLIDGYGKY